MDLNTPHELNDAQKMELAIVTRMHQILAETHPGLSWLDAPGHKRLQAKKMAEDELDTPGKRLDFYAVTQGRRD